MLMFCWPVGSRGIARVPIPERRRHADVFRGLPGRRCFEGPTVAATAPTPAPRTPSAIDGRESKLDLGKCLFCNECATSLPEGRCGTLRLSPGGRAAATILFSRRQTLKLAEALDEKSRRLSAVR